MSFFGVCVNESVNETTGVSPNTMVYGRLPHGPLTLLRDIWVREDKFLIPKNKSTTEFFKDLHDRLETARNYAEDHAKKEQRRYTERYNRHARDKYFLLVSLSLFCRKTRLHPRCLVSGLVLRLW